MRLELESVLHNDLLERLVEVRVGLDILHLLVLVPASRLQIVDVEVIDRLADFVNFMVRLVEHLM